MLKVVGASWFQTRISTCIVATVGALGVLAIILGEMASKKSDGVYSATVYWSETAGFNINFWGQGNILQDVPQGAARAYHKQEITTNGWAVLEIQTNREYPDWVQAFAAGFLEGSLTWQLIHWHWLNTVKHACDGRQQFCDHVYLLMKENSVFMEERAEQYGDKDPFWHQVRLFYMQLHGIESGWQRGVQRARHQLQISHIDFLWMNMVSDLPDLEKKFNSSSFLYSTATSFTSAFVKLQSKELFVAHNTGGLYQSMLRILKCYQFGYHYTSSRDSKLVPGQLMVFTSYPGVVHSQDDFYLVSGRPHNGKQPDHFAITGTSFAYYNKILWSKIKPSEKVWIGARVMAANRLARNGSSWGKTLARFASDTGNKQWLFVDLARHNTVKHDSRENDVLKHTDKKSLLWVVEQLPGRTHIMEHHLRTVGYLFSNGVSLHTLGSSGAALIESEDVDIDTVLHLMRRETFKEHQNMVPMGIIDTKVISSSSLQMQLVSGPVQSCNNTCTSFTWSTSPFINITHEGHPDKWSFNTFHHNWEWSLPSL